MESEDQVHSDLLVQIASELTTTNPDQALHLGLISLSDSYKPQDFGRLLFALGNATKAFGDKLFRAALTTLRRNDFVYDDVLLSLINYLFSSTGSLYPDATVADPRKAYLLDTDLSTLFTRDNKDGGLISLEKTLGLQR